MDQNTTPAAKAPYRIETVTRSVNPNYVPMSTRPRTRYPDIETRSAVYFETLEAAQEHQAAHGGTICKLSASGKSYQRLR